MNGDIDSPTSFDEIERPPLRYIDKYGMSARYTVAFMAMMGFIISFGMKCNLSAAKPEREKTYNETMHGMCRKLRFYEKIIFSKTRKQLKIDIKQEAFKEHM